MTTVVLCFFRVILSACSPYFRAMFTGELAESRQTEVTIRDIDEVAMELLIDFCYTSHVVVEEGNVQTLLPAGEWEVNDIITEIMLNKYGWNYFCEDIFKPSGGWHFWSSCASQSYYMILPVERLRYSCTPTLIEGVNSSSACQVILYFLWNPYFH